MDEAPKTQQEWLGLLEAVTWLIANRALTIEALHLDKKLSDELGYQIDSEINARQYLISKGYMTPGEDI